jgi:dephospho-CoA kinase
MMTRARSGGKGRPEHTIRRPAAGCTLSDPAMHERHTDRSAGPPAGRPEQRAEPRSGAPPGATRRTVVLAVLGGIASGKSQVARRLAGPAGVVISADDLAHAALEAPEIRAEVVRAFGAAVVGADGAIDRAALAAVVFRDTASRRRLEGWIHPWVRARIYAALEEARTEGRPRVVLDVPLLLENDAQHGLVRVCDHLVFVEVGAAERERRARETRGWEPGELARREAAQLPLDEKRRRATVVVRNEGTLAELDVAIDKALVALNL